MLAPHVVVRLGRALADLVGALTGSETADSGELSIGECAVQYQIDPSAELLRVVGVEPALAPAYAEGIV